MLAIPEYVKQTHVIEQLHRLAKNRIVPSLLFSGPSGLGKHFCVQYLAALLFGGTSKLLSRTHPDLTFIAPEGKTGMHSIESIRNLSQTAQLTPLEAKYHIFVIESASRMPFPAANALLKLLEEPPKHCVLILLAENKFELLPTILSRLQEIPFSPLATEEIEAIIKDKLPIDTERLKQILYLSDGSIKKALMLIEKDWEEIFSAITTILEKGKALSYQELTLLCQKIAENIEKQQKNAITLENSRLLEQYPDLPQKEIAYQQRHFEGIFAVKEREHIAILFTQVLLWFQNQTSYSTKTLRYVNQLAVEALTAVERQTKLTIVLETFFLKIREFI